VQLAKQLLPKDTPAQLKEARSKVAEVSHGMG